MKNPTMIKSHKELQTALGNRHPVEISYETFFIYLTETNVLFKAQIINGVLISHAYQEKEHDYSRRIYFFEREVNHEWRYYAQFAQSFHVSESVYTLQYSQNGDSVKEQANRYYH